MTLTESVLLKRWATLEGIIAPGYMLMTAGRDMSH